MPLALRRKEPSGAVCHKWKSLKRDCVIVSVMPSKKTIKKQQQMAYYVVGFGALFAVLLFIAFVFNPGQEVATWAIQPKEWSCQVDHCSCNCQTNIGETITWDTDPVQWTSCVKTSASLNRDIKDACVDSCNATEGEQRSPSGGSCESAIQPTAVPRQAFTPTPGPCTPTNKSCSASNTPSPY